MHLSPCCPGGHIKLPVLCYVSEDNHVQTNLASALGSQEGFSYALRMYCLVRGPQASLDGLIMGFIVGVLGPTTSRGAGDKGQPRSSQPCLLVPNKHSGHGGLGALPTLWEVFCAHCHRSLLGTITNVCDSPGRGQWEAPSDALCLDSPWADFNLYPFLSSAVITSTTFREFWVLVNCQTQGWFLQPLNLWKSSWGPANSADGEELMAASFLYSINHLLPQYQWVNGISVSIWASPRQVADCV